MVQLDVARRYGARSFLRDPEFGRIARVHTNGYLLQVQENIDDVLLHTFDTRVLVQYPFYLHFRDRRTRHRRQQDATQRIAKRMTEAALERLDRDLRLKIVDRRDLDDTRFQKLMYRFLHGNNPS